MVQANLIGSSVRLSVWKYQIYSCLSLKHFDVVLHIGITTVFGFK